MVIEATCPRTSRAEGPWRKYPATSAPAPSPVIEVKCVTYRKEPLPRIGVGLADHLVLLGNFPRRPASTTWSRAWCPRYELFVPISRGAHVYVQVKKTRPASARRSSWPTLPATAA